MVERKLKALFTLVLFDPYRVCVCVEVGEKGKRKAMKK
jgi:hypothetical protein